MHSARGDGGTGRQQPPKRWAPGAACRSGGGDAGCATAASNNPGMALCFDRVCCCAALSYRGSEHKRGTCTSSIPLQRTGLWSTRCRRTRTNPRVIAYGTAFPSATVALLRPSLSVRRDLRYALDARSESLYEIRGMLMHTPSPMMQSPKTSEHRPAAAMIPHVVNVLAPLRARGSGHIRITSVHGPHVALWRGPSSTAVATEHLHRSGSSARRAT
jgi:hypothetical protein